MAIRILFIGNQIRHELGCAASLAIQGYNVIYAHIGTRYTALNRINVYTDIGSTSMPVCEARNIPLSWAFISPERFIKAFVPEFQYDVVIVNPSVPFYLGRAVAKKQSIPLVLRVWGIRANKLIEHVAYGKNYLEFLDFYPSVMHNLLQILNSQAVVAMDDSTADFLHKFYLYRRLSIIYPTYAALYDINARTSSKVEELIENRDYIFSFVTMSKTGSVLRLEQPLFKILYLIARRCPEINVVIAGGTAEEARRKFKLQSLPNNLLFAGKGLSDNELKKLYQHASLVVIPVFFKSVSNRLLEALFYGKPILTNSIASQLHNKLKNSVLISDNYSDYPNIVKKLFKDSSLLQELALRAKETYSSFFSARKCGLAMGSVIESLIG